MDKARLISLLRCPETMQTVRVANAAELANCNQRIAAGDIFTKSGIQRTEKLTAGLLREDARLLFPVENDIPVMLIEEALVLS